MYLKRKKIGKGYNKPLVNSNERFIRSNKVLQFVRPEVNTTFRLYTSNLPVSLTPFIGRQTEVETICQLVNDPAVRLVTLYGTAGLGKTRLSLAVGEQLQNYFRDGVFFVNLAPLNKPEAGLAAIAQALGLEDQRHLPLLEKLKNYLQKRAILLILDNFEQIISLGLAISELLEVAPKLKIIVTSRVVLRLYGESVYNVPPLHLAELAETTSFETICQNEAVNLFNQRARMVNPQFQLTRETAQTVAQLCLHLEGLPLAIELAAARCGLFSPQILLDRLGSGKRLDLLIGGFSNLPTRQQTLANALEWSYQLLSEPEKQLFRRSGIFVGSCSLEAAQALSTEPTSTVETVISLLNTSLLKQVEAMPGEELRFTMLETIREFALKKLAEAGELEMARIAYNRYFIEMVETGISHLQKSDYLNWLKRLEADHSNVLNALDCLIENEEAEGAFQLGGAIWLAWWRWGYLNQGRQWLNKILKLDRSKVDKFLQAKVLDGVAYLAMHQNEGQVAVAHFEESLKIWREGGISRYLGNAVSGLAGTYRILGEYEKALQLNYESLETFRSLGDESNEADALCNIAWQLLERGNYEQVQPMLEKSLAMHRKSNYLSGVARAQIYLGDLLWRRNEPATAICYLEEAVTMLQQVKHRIRLPSALYRLGLVYLCQGQLALAEKVLEESIEIAEGMHKLLDLTYAYSNLGLLRMVQNDLARAEALFQQALNLRPEIGQLEGILWAMEGLAVIALEQGDYEQAQHMMEDSQLLRQRISAPVLPHTLKFILPTLLNASKPGKAQLNRLGSEPQMTGIDGAVENKPSVTSRKVDLPASLGLETAIALSKRENEVLQLVAQGYSSSQIAKILVISAGTVNNHLNSIYSKLGVNSRTAAIRYALDHGLL